MLTGFILVGISIPVYSSKDSSRPASQDFIDKSNTAISKSKQLTFVGPRSGEGYFSRDGKKMIFQSEREAGNPFYQMYVLDLESGKTTRVSTGQGQTTCGWIHPNMQTVMWSSTHLDPHNAEKVQTEMDKRNNPIKQKYSWAFDDQFSIFTSDLNGKNVKRLTTEKGYNAEGSYSPDGKYIAFASNRQAYNKKLSAEDQKILDRDASYFMDIYIMDADGKNVRQLTNTPGYDGGPFFSSDGKKITWRRFNPDGSKAEIYTMNVDGSDQKQITSLGSMSWAPFFHPSGDYIIFASSVLGFANFELFIVDSQGKQKPVRVTFSDGFDGLASFSPDGRKVTWAHRNEKGESQIYLADWNDTEARKLLNLPVPEQQKQSAPAPYLALADLNPTINEADARNIIQYMASEELKGRFTGSAEELQYANTMSELFKEWGLKPAVGQNFLQPFEFVSGVELEGKNAVTLKGALQKPLVLEKDYQVVSYSKSGQFMEMPLAFVGYGIKAPASAEMAAFDSYADLDVTGKWVVVFDESPKPGTRDFKKHMNLVSYSGLQHKISIAKNKGATGFILIEEGKIGPLKFDGALADSQIPVIKISKQVFEDILTKVDVDKSLKSYKNLKEKYETYENTKGFLIPSQYLAADIQLKTLKSTGHNVVAVLDPTTAQNRSRKALLIGAHGDHLGLGQTGSSLAKGEQKGQIHYGADDNASGVAGVLELAHYYSARKKDLKKPLVFAVWSGEEIGVLGSNYFVKNYQKQSVSKKSFTDAFEAGLNMDMIGRLKDYLFVQGVGSATGWSRISEAIAMKADVPLSLTQDPYLPTDSMSIYLGGIPSITFFTGAHSEYHTPNDKPDTLNYKGLVTNIKVVQNFIEQILNAPKGQELKFEKVEGNSGQKLAGRGFRIFLGTIPDYSQEGVKGVKISGTAKDSPAEKAGLKSGDVITHFDSIKIDNIYDYVYTLQSVKPNVKTKIHVLREGKSLELDITPTLKE